MDKFEMIARCLGKKGYRGVDASPVISLLDYGFLYNRSKRRIVHHVRGQLYDWGVHPDEINEDYRENKDRLEHCGEWREDLLLVHKISDLQSIGFYLPQPYQSVFTDAFVNHYLSPTIADL